MEKKPNFNSLYLAELTKEEAIIPKYQDGCEKIWTDYVTPLQSQLSEAEKEIEYLKGKKQRVFELAKANRDWHRKRYTESQYENERLLSALKESKVYGIYSGSIHEGGGCEGDLYDTIQAAREAALKEVAKHQEQDDDCYGDLEPRLVPVEPWKEEEPNRWNNTIWCISVQEFNLNRTITY